MQIEGLDFDSDDLFPVLSDLPEETKLKCFSMTPKNYFDKMFDEKQFDTLETSFVITLFEFLRRDLEEKDKIISNMTGKNLLNTLQKKISPWKPNNPTRENFDVPVESSPLFLNVKTRRIATYQTQLRNIMEILLLKTI